MADRVRVEIEGVKQTLKLLRQIDPELRKQFTKDARRVAAPIMDEAKSRYTRVPLSGFNRTWAPRGRQITPKTIGRYRSGVGFKVDASKKAEAVFSVIQRNAAASVFDMAGRRRPNALDASFERAGWGRASRVMWPAAEAKQDQVRDALIDLIDQAADTINRELARN